MLTELTPGSVYHDLTAFQRDLLTVLTGHDAPSGVEVREDMNAYYTSSVEHSRLYQALNRLAEKGLVEISEKDARTNAYCVTTRGLEVVRAGREFREEMTGGGGDV